MITLLGCFPTSMARCPFEDAGSASRKLAPANVPRSREKAEAKGLGSRVLCFRAYTMYPTPILGNVVESKMRIYICNILAGMALIN